MLLALLAVSQSAKIFEDVSIDKVEDRVEDQKVYLRQPFQIRESQILRKVSLFDPWL